jgi:DNA-directed RNA polymerase subunit RPC12/RpoP
LHESQTEHDEIIASEDKPKVAARKYSCNICGQTFEAKWEVVAHRKKNHLSTLRKCKYFIAGHCSFGENLCWFKHDENDNSFPQTITEYKCGICGNKYDYKKEFMQHRKREHINYVSECRENENGC